MSEHATSFFRVDCDVMFNVRVRRAGALLPHGCAGDALLVYLAVLAEHKRRGQTGRIDADHAEVDAFGFALLAMGIPADRLAAALDACCKTGLLEREEDGGLKLLGWDDFWRTGRTSTQRSRDRRNTTAAQQDATDGNGYATGCNGDATAMQRAATGRNGTQRTATKCNVPPSREVQSSPVQSSPVKTSQDKPSPSSPTPPSAAPDSSTRAEDGPIADTIDQDLTALGIASSRHRATAARNLREYAEPGEVLRLIAKHARRYGEDVPALLATILADKHQVGLALREAAEKAENLELRSKIENLVASLRLRALAKERQAAT